MTKEKYHKMREEGRCYICGKPLDNPNSARCSTCMSLKETHPHIKEIEKVKTANNKSLDEMATEAHRRGVSYGKLQSEETIDRIRAAERADLTLKKWGRSVLFG